MASSIGIFSKHQTGITISAASRKRNESGEKHQNKRSMAMKALKSDGRNGVSGAKAAA